VTMVCVVTLVCSAACAAPVVRKGHPRIFFTQADLPEIAKRCGPGGMFEKSYEQIKRTLSRRAMNPRSGYYPGWGRAVAEMAFCYLVETQLGRDGSKYLDHIKTKTWKGDGSGMGSAFGWDAVVYDWIYNTLSPEEKKLFGDRLGACLRWHTNQPVIVLRDGSATYWYNQSWALFMGKGWSRDGLAPKTMVALAIDGEGTAHQGDVAQWLNSFATRMPEEFVEKLDLLGGPWPEGPGHGRMLYEPFITWEAWRFATGQDLFVKVAPTGFHREAPYWHIYAVMPHIGGILPIDDMGPAAGVRRPGRGSDDHWVSFNALHAARYRDGVTQHLSRADRDAGTADWADIIWQDPTVPAIDPKALPPAYLFRGQGQLYMRSGWNGPDDTFAFFSAGPYFLAYGIFGENGTFYIAKQGTLVGNGGYDYENMKMPSSQNIMLVYAPSEKFLSNSHKPLRNEGGSLMPVPWNVLTPIERGKITAYEQTPAYTYVGADLAKAYSSKVKSYTRQFLYVRSEPEFFVVYDRVSADAAFPKTWLLHLQAEPEVTAAGKTVQPSARGEGFQSFAGTDLVFAHVKPGSDDNFKTKKRGAVAVRTLLPKAVTITKRGGVGHEMWGNPHDPDASNLTPGRRRRSNTDICLWRMEVEPAQARGYERFLHVIVPYGDAAGKSSEQLSPKASDFQLIQGKRDGVRLTLGGKTWEITFTKSGPMEGFVKIQGPGPAVDAALTTTVKPNPVPPGLAISGQVEP